MLDVLSVILGSYREAIAEALGDKLSRIVLFGSYARGDFNQNSDMDLMILADAHPEEISYYADLVYDITYDFEEKYGMEINPCVQSIYTFEHWKKTYPFFMNVEKDGVNI
ncbi:MAG: nucleotidyltransferase domain-containing protein [Hespellia sp.]|nr:nucleotidyltransferase domain-containing protein [Hespellia sp.]